MGRIVLATESTMTTPSSGDVRLTPLSGTKRFTSIDDAGLTLSIPHLTNCNTADVVASAADTYLTGSSISVPTHKLQAKTMFKWRFAMTKSAAGVAAPIWRVRIGTAGSTSDAAILTFTQVALQTAVVDTGIVEITAILRNTGAAGILAGSLSLLHVLAITGFSTLGENIMQVNSAGFDTTVANLIVGVSVNPGASGVWTHQLVMVEAFNL